MSQIMPISRTDLAPGAPVRAAILAACDNPGEHQTWSMAFESFDRLFAEVDELRAANRAHVERVVKEGALQVRAERNAIRYEGLPEDVRELQEEVAAWKDQYAATKRALAFEKADAEVVAIERDEALEKVEKARKRSRSWKKQATELAGAVGRQHLEIEAAEADAVKAQEYASAVAAELCMENKDHENVIRFTAEDLLQWLHLRGNLVNGSEGGPTVAKYLYTDAVARVNKRRLAEQNGIQA